MALAALLMGTGLAGCGRAGALEPPPDPHATVATGTQPDAAPRRPKTVPIAKPHESFILDPLL